MRLTLRRKVIGLAVTSATLPLICLLVLLILGEEDVSRNVEADLTFLARKNIEQIARDVYGLCNMTQQISQRHLANGMQSVHYLLTKMGYLEASPKATVEWQAVNQENGVKLNVTLPKMTINGQWFGQSRNFSDPMPAVDDAFLLTGMDISIFQRMNDAGDMLRVASHLKAKDGLRSVGTFIPAIGADGRPNEVIQAILAGRAYRGMVNFWGESSVTAYDPIRTPDGKVIGMIGTGLKAQAMDLLIRTIREIKVGRTGYVFVVGAKGERRGVYLISKDGRRDGQNILDSKDAAGKLFIREMIDTVEKRPRGEVNHFRYIWQNPNDSSPRIKITAVAYFEPFDWVIGVGTYEDDYFAAREKVKSEIQWLLWKLMLAGIVLLVLAIMTAILFGNRLARPLDMLMGIAQHVAKGDLYAAKKSLNIKPDAEERDREAEKRTGDEIEQLTRVFRTMTIDLASLIGEVQNAGVAVTTSTTQIAASARELEATVAEQAASTREVTASSREISHRSGELVETMGGVGSTVSETAGLAQTGQGGISGMGAAMNRLVRATESISTRLAVISERANRISVVVTTINKISDQTTILSLNAAIEAEKAGEYGKGFSVVAREISRLADRTAAATQDIDNMVREMQSSVSSGVMEMDKFADEVRRGVAEVNTIGEQLARIILEVRTLEPRFISVTQGMNAQAESASQISEAMSQLSISADQTREALSEFNRVTAHLNDAVKGLLREVSHFRVREDPNDIEGS